MDYKNAGVDIEAGYRSVELMKKHVAATIRPEMLGGLGGFSGAFSLEKYKAMEKPTLVDPAIISTAPNPLRFMYTSFPGYTFCPDEGQRCFER